MQSTQLFGWESHPQRLPSTNQWHGSGREFPTRAEHARMPGNKAESKQGRKQNFCVSFCSVSATAKVYGTRLAAFISKPAKYSKVPSGTTGAQAIDLITFWPRGIFLGRTA